MANLAVTLELDSQGYIRNIKAADSQTKDFAKDATTAFNKVDQSMGQLNQKSNNLAQGFGKLRSAIAGVAIGSFAISALQGADAIVDLSNATDISVAKLLEFREALQRAGGSGDDAAKAITTLFASVDQANTGNDKTIANFAKLGVTFENLRTLSESDLLDATIKGFERITDPIEQAAIKTDLFGKTLRTVSAKELGQEMLALKGTMDQQAASTLAAEKAVQNFEKFVNSLKGAVLIVLDPLLKLTGATDGSASSSQKLAEALKVLISLYVALKAAALAAFITQSALNALQAAGMAKNPILAAAAGLAALTAARVGYTGMMDLMKEVEDQAGKTNASLAKPGAATPAKDSPRNRPQDIGKELAGQLNAVNSLADGYRRAAQANMDRYTTEVEILGKSKEEQELIKATADINKRYADQTAALEEKRKGAKGDTLALINKEIANLEGLRTSELDILSITNDQVRAYARQQQEVKNIVDLMEQQAEYAREIAEFQNQQGQAVMAAYEQVKAQTQALALTGQREQLEKSILNLRGSDQTKARELFDLEAQRKTQLEAIQKIQNLPFEGQGGMKQRLQEINDLYDQRKIKIEETAAATKVEQDSFAFGWANAGEKFRNNIKTDAEYAAQQFSNFTRGFEDAFVKFVQTGKLSIKDLANSMIADFARVQAQKMLAGLFGGGAGGGFFGSIGKIFGFANGGMPPVGQPSLVGERGPELFVPQSAGRIIPNNKLGMGGGETQVINTAVTYSIQAVDAQSFKSLLARDPEFIHNVAEQGRRSLPIRSRR
jgi:lambda family phage tail tape measure protein